MTAISSRIKNGLNTILRPLNVRVGTWTAIDREHARIAALQQRGALDKPLYALTEGMRRFDPAWLSGLYEVYSESIARLMKQEANAFGYDPANSYFSSPDAEVLYLMVRGLSPRRIVEVGCGNSTRVSRQAILDGGLDTQVIGIDPHPRLDVAKIVDRLVQQRLEETDDIGIFEALESNDILFIDSSHEAFVGNDVANLFCRVIPALKPGVVVHVHDVFLPYDYPADFAYDYSSWGEQYILHAMMFGRNCKVLWPGYYAQREYLDLRQMLPFLTKGRAQSFWFVW